MYRILVEYSWKMIIKTYKGHEDAEAVRLKPAKVALNEG